MNDRYRAFSERLFDQNKFAIKLGLDNIQRALEREGRPERSHRCIVVGGTNGKGETSAILSNVLQAHGERVGFYSSPHLVEVRERFRIDGVPISREEMVAIGDDVLERYGEACDPVLTFFEMTTLIAATVFRDAGVTAAIYEVGLGGRLDAVNALDRELVIISDIGRDHQAYLGETLDEIVFEKMSLATGYDTIISPQTESWRSDLEHPRCMRVPAASTPELQNRATALRAASHFLGSDYDDQLANRAADHTRWPGRFDRQSVEFDGRSLEFLFDAAHNVPGARFFAERLSRSDFQVDRIVVGLMRDKEIDAIVEVLASVGRPLWGVQIGSERSMTVEELEETGQFERVFASSGELCAELAGSTAVCGSIYLLGEFFERFSLPVSIQTDEFA